MAYWLMKSEPKSYSIDDLQRDGMTAWDGVRNYQVRNMMRDDMAMGDLAFFYHSNSKPPAIVGMMEVVSTAYCDSTAFDPEDHHYDAKSDPNNPRWLMVDVQFKKKFPYAVSLEYLRQQTELREMPLLRAGNRLSVTAVSPQQWQHILHLAMQPPESYGKIDPLLNVERRAK